MCYVYGKIFGGRRSVLWKRELVAFQSSVLFHRGKMGLERSRPVKTLVSSSHATRRDYSPIECE